MATFLFKDIIIGPVISRRLGLSLGINLLPSMSKICTFNCIYCECGLNPKKEALKTNFPNVDEVAKKLKIKLKELSKKGKNPDVITFAGNGEPTLHPKFAEIIEITINLRNAICPQTRIAVLSNTTRIHISSVFRALLKIDDNIQKLDSAIPETIKILNNPIKGYELRRTVDLLKKFDGKVIIQTLFLKGSYNENKIDNSTDNEVEAWLKLIKEISPQKVMIYSLARSTPVETLEKISQERMYEIAEKVQKENIEVQVSG